MKLSIDESKLYSEDKKNPTIQLLLEINRQQAEFIQQLKDEINRLKKTSTQTENKAEQFREKKKNPDRKKAAKEPVQRRSSKPPK